MTLSPSHLLSRLKSMYREQREKLTATGAGLVDDDREDEIVPGSELANLWGMYVVCCCSWDLY